MMESLVVPTLWGNNVRVRLACDHEGKVTGAGVDFLTPDPRFVRDMESLTRLDALKIGLALCEYACTELPAREATELYHQAVNDLLGAMGEGPGRANIFPFPVGEISFPSTVEAPADGATLRLPPTPSAGEVETPAL